MKVEKDNYDNWKNAWNFRKGIMLENIRTIQISSSLRRARTG